MTVARLAAALASVLLLSVGAGPVGAQSPRPPAPGPQGPDLAIQKSGAATVAVGQTATFQVSASNPGPVAIPAGLITVTDQIQPPLTAPVTASGSNWNCVVAGTQVTCRYMAVAAAGATLPPITITAAATTPGRFSNCASVKLAAVSEANQANNRSCLSGIIQPPLDRFDVGVRKAAGPSIVGQPTTFTLSPFNVGPASVGAGNVVTVTDVLPANFTAPITASGLGGWNCVVVGQTVTCTYGGPPVAAGKPLPPITINAMTRSPGAWRNCARIRLRGADANGSNDEACIPGNAGGGDGRGFDIGIRKTGPAVVKAGQAATFKLNTYNVGPSSVDGQSGIRVTDLLPANFVGPITAGGSGWNCNVSGSGPYLVVCDYFGAAVPANGQLPTITIGATAKGVGGWRNCAEITLKIARDMKDTDNRSCIGGEVRPGDLKEGYDLSIGKRGPETYTAGQPASFVLTPFNRGPSTVDGMSGVIVTDTLAAGLTAPITVNASNGWICVVSGLTVECRYNGVAVPAGQSMGQITITATVQSSDEIRNCVEIDLKAGKDLRPEDNRTCVSGPITDKPRPDLAVDKVALKGPWTWPNGQGQFGITITNVGNVVLPAGHTLTIVEAIPAGMTFAAVPVGWNCSPAPVANGPVQVTCSRTLTAPLAPGASITTLIRVGFWGPRLKTYENCVRVLAFKGKLPWKEVNTENNRDCAPADVGGGGGFDLSVGKIGPGALIVGQSATFTLTPHNNGPSTVDKLSGVEVVDTLSGGLVPPVTFATTADWSCSVVGLTVTCKYIGLPVPAGQNLPSIDVTATAGAAGDYRNCVQIFINTAKDINAGNDKACVKGQIADKPAGYDVDITKTGPASVTLGQTTQFTLSPTNNGPSSVGAGTGLVVKDILPSSFTGPITATGSGWDCVVLPPQVTCTYKGSGVFAAGDPLPPITIKAVANSAGSIENCATIGLKPKDLNPKDNISCTGIQVIAPTRPDLSATKTYSGYAPSGGMNWILIATNKGPGPWAGPVTFTDTLPAGLTPAAGYGSYWTCSISGQTITCVWNGPAVAVGDVFPELDIHAMPAGPGTYRNCATVSVDASGRPDPTPNDNTACASGTYQPASLTVTKSIIDDCYQNLSGVDTVCTFRITVTNSGSTPWSGPVKFSDTILPQNMSFPTLVGGSPAGWGCVGSQPMICTSNSAISLAPGASITVDYTVDIHSLIAQHQNCVSLVLPNATDPSCVTLGGAAAPNLSIEKTVVQDCTGVVPAIVCKFVIRVFNNGSTQYMGQLTFTDLVSYSGTPIYGVSLAQPHPGGWVCTGNQPLSCLSGPVSIPPGGFITVPLSMTINGPIPANRNCATLTLPVTDGPSCVPLGNTHYDFELDTNFMEDFAAPGFHELSFWVGSTPQVAIGEQVIVTGSLTPAGFFLPTGPIPNTAVTSPGWNCSGTWASFLCTQTVTAASFTNGYLVLRLRTSFPASASGQTFTYVGSVTKSSNIDPDTSNNARTVTTTLP